jgi:hypothetical protein
VNSHSGTLSRKSPLPTRDTDNLRGGNLHHEYRGHRIRLIMAQRWTAELVELATGALLPTKLTADEDESFHALAARARRLVDTYLDFDQTTVRVFGPARPWQTILSQSPSARRL